MKHFNIIGIFLLLGGVGNAMATCKTEGYTVNGSANLNGYRIHAQSFTTPEVWDEDHCTSNVLNKVGDGTPADPYSPVGTWGLSSGGKEVSYFYTGGSSFNWGVWRKTGSGGKSSICWEDLVTNAVIATGTELGPITCGP